MSRRAGLSHPERYTDQGPLSLANGLVQTATAFARPQKETPTLTSLESSQNHGVLPKLKGA